MIRVIDARILRREEFVLSGGLVFETVVAEFVTEPGLLGGKPQVVEIAEPGALADLAKGMNVAVAKSRPVLE